MMNGRPKESGTLGISPNAGARLVMLAGGALSALALVAINSVLPAIDAALAHSPADSLLVKQLAGGVGLAMAVGSILAGFMTERAGVRPVLTLAVFVYVLAGTAGLYLTDLWLLLASRLLLGLAASTIQITALALINTRLEGSRRAQWMGLHISIAMGTTILAQPIAGLLGDMGWRWPFALYGLGLMLLPAIFSYRKAAPAAVSAHKAAAGASAGDRAGFWKEFPIHYLPLAILLGCIVFLPMVYASFLLRERGITSPSTIGLILMADSVAGIIMSSQYGRARKYLSHHGAFAVCLLVSAAGMIVTGFSSDTFGLVCGLLIFGLGVGWFVPNLMTSVGEKVGPQWQARSVGMVKSAHFLAGSIGLLLTEPLARHYGPVAVMFAVAGVALVLLALVLMRSGFGAGLLRGNPAEAALSSPG